MNPRPAAVAFDVLGTLFSLEALRPRLQSAGLPSASLELWFAQTLRDAMALDATGVFMTFREVAAAALAGVFAGHDHAADSVALGQVLDGFAELEAQPDAAHALEDLHCAGVRVVTLSNGSAESTRKLLKRAGLERFVEKILSIEDVRHWKPRREVYLHAATALALEPSAVALVAAHAWDIHGARRAGLAGVYVARGQPFPATMAAPDVHARTLAEAAARLLELRTSTGAGAQAAAGAANAHP